MNQNTIDRLLKNIISIEDKKQKIFVDINTITVTKYPYKHNKNSEMKSYIYKIILNGKEINKKNNYRIKYQCLFCQHESIVNLEVFTNKMSNNNKKCQICYELGNGTKMIKNCEEIIKNSQSIFMELDNDMQDNYFRKYLTLEEYEHLRPHICSFQNDKYKNIKDFEYYPYIKIYEGREFCPKIYDMKRDVL